MNTFDCIRSRRSIRQFKPDKIEHSLLEHIISIASYAPSWKNTQIARYIAIDDASILQTIASDHLPDFNSRTVSSAPLLIALTFLKNRSGFERDGSFSTPKTGNGRCLTPESPLRLFVWPLMRRALAASLWVCLTLRGSAGCYICRIRRNWRL